MSFSLPNFNLTFQAKANFNFALGANPVGPFILVGTPCNLAYSKRVHFQSVLLGDTMILLFPKLVALKGRDSYAVNNGDAVEVPQGSGRWYSVAGVDRVAAGFANEHQAASIFHPRVVYNPAPLWPAP